jgi:hypothetical protein
MRGGRRGGDRYFALHRTIYFLLAIQCRVVSLAYSTSEQQAVGMVVVERVCSILLLVLARIRLLLRWPIPSGASRRPPVREMRMLLFSAYCVLSLRHDSASSGLSAVVLHQLPVERSERPRGRGGGEARSRERGRGEREGREEQRSRSRSREKRRKSNATYFLLQTHAQIDFLLIARPGHAIEEALGMARLDGTDELAAGWWSAGCDCAEHITGWMREASLGLTVNGGQRGSRGGTGRDGAEEKEVANVQGPPAMRALTKYFCWDIQRGVDHGVSRACVV